MKIAFLFLIYDKIEQEELWNNFFKGVDKDKYSIYIHGKNTEYAKPLRFFEDKKLGMSLPTKYGDISLVYAQKLLLKMALKDKNNYKFIFLSGSCVPFKKFDYIYDILMENELSYFDIVDYEKSQKACFPRCDSVLKHLNKEIIHKASQWCILNQEHAKLCLEDIKVIEYFNDVFAPEEHYFITLCMLYLPGTICNDGKTFVNWDESDDPDGCSPKTYKSITIKEYKDLCNSPFLFTRKFTEDCQVNCNDFSFRMVEAFDILVNS
jgi:hypothetical protein